MTKGKVHSFFKHTFIPHEGNDYKPHFFREAVVLSLIAISIFLLGVSFGSSFFLKRTVLGASVTASVLVDLANETRLAYNEPLLTRNNLLDQAAMLKGQDMTNRGYFAHDSPDGVTPWHWFKEVGYSFIYAGENLAVNFTESQDVQNAWLNSPKHKENLINKNFREIGIATVEGTYKNIPTIFVVQMFGTPAKAETKGEPAIEKTITIEEADENKEIATGTPEVRGETAPNKKPVVKTDIATTTSPEPQKLALEKIVETKELAIVKNTEAATPTPGTTSAPITYAPWYGKFVFGSSDYIDTIYKILIGIVLIALLLMVVVEIKRQHYKHISYGVLMVVILVILVYINKAFIN